MAETLECPLCGCNVVAEARVKWLEHHTQKAINEIDQAQGNFNGVLPEEAADAIRDILVDGKDRQGEI